MTHSAVEALSPPLTLSEQHFSDPPGCEASRISQKKHGQPSKGPANIHGHELILKGNHRLTGSRIRVREELV